MPAPAAATQPCSPGCCSREPSGRSSLASDAHNWADPSRAPAPAWRPAVRDRVPAARFRRTWPSSRRGRVRPRPPPRSFALPAYHWSTELRSDRQGRAPWLLQEAHHQGGADSEQTRVQEEWPIANGSHQRGGTTHTDQATDSLGAVEDRLV